MGLRLVTDATDTDNDLDCGELVNHTVGENPASPTRLERNDYVAQRILQR